MAVFFAASYYLMIRWIGSKGDVSEFFSSKKSKKVVESIKKANWNSIHGEKKAKELAYFFTNLQRSFGFNGNVLIAQKGNILWHHSYGFADNARKEPLNQQCVFQIASVSKQFTAIAILQLVEQGKLKLSDNVSSILIGFPYKDVSIHHLLCHRSGLFNYMYFCDEHADRKHPISNREVVQLINRYRPTPFFGVDKRFDYSNTGYALLASIVEEVAKMPFASYAQKFLFEPAGMDSTVVFDLNHPVNISGKSIGIDRNGKPAEDTYLDGVVGDKGIYTTVNDLYKWDQALYSNVLVAQDLIEKAFQPYSPEKKKEENYGYGFRVREYKDGKKVVYHAGWWHGYHALFMRLLHNQSTIIMLSNRVNWSIKNIDQLQAILNEE